MPSLVLEPGVWVRHTETGAVGQIVWVAEDNTQFTTRPKITGSGLVFMRVHQAALEQAQPRSIVGTLYAGSSDNLGEVPDPLGGTCVITLDTDIGSDVHPGDEVELFVDELTGEVISIKNVEP